MGGELSVEDEEVLEERIEDVTCRWCGTGTSVEAVDEPVGAAADPEAVTGS